MLLVEFIKVSGTIVFGRHNVSAVLHLVLQLQAQSVLALQS